MAHTHPAVFLATSRYQANNQALVHDGGAKTQGAGDMPIFMRHAVDVKPFEGPREAGPDVSLDGTGFHLPAAVDVQHEVHNKAVDLSFRLAGDVNGDGTLHLDIELLVPAVQHTDFHSG